MPIPESTCQKDRQPCIGECCCTCRHRAEDYGHPGTNGKTIMDLRGYVCLCPGRVNEHGQRRVISGWTEHGQCEMWEEAKGVQGADDGPIPG